MPDSRMSRVFLISLLLVPIGCKRGDSPEAADPASQESLTPSQGDHEMSDPPSDEFESLLETSYRELQAKTEAHTAWGLGSFDQWSVDQDEATIVFSNADGTTAVAPVQIIGTFNTKDNSWLWAWDNPSILDTLKQDALKLKKYGEDRGIDQLTARKWIGAEEDAWAMAALAVKLCGSQGAYRGPAGPSYVFMTFGEVTLSKKGADE